jgi:HNH endonuclease
MHALELVMSLTNNQAEDICVLPDPDDNLRYALLRQSGKPLKRVRRCALGHLMDPDERFVSTDSEADRWLCLSCAHRVASLYMKQQFSLTVEDVAVLLTQLPQPAGTYRRTAPPKAQRQRIHVRDAYRCRYCGDYESGLTIDHVQPLSREGSNDDSNLVTCCSKCNTAKGARTPEEAEMPLRPLGETP